MIDYVDSIVTDSDRDAEWALAEGMTLDNQHDSELTGPEFAYTDSVSPFDTPYM
jgi:hypothetical protein